jgi:hypothetical protein
MLLPLPPTFPPLVPLFPRPCLFSCYRVDVFAIAVVVVSAIVVVNNAKPPPSNYVSFIVHHAASLPSNANTHHCPSLPLSLLLPITFAANHRPLPSDGIIASHRPLLLSCIGWTLYG